MGKKTKLYLLTGFLGSGKTTFLTNTLKDLSEKRVGVIMNEFGKVGIDGTIIKKEDMELIEINRGSIFCSCLQLSFVSALVDMADRDMDYVFVESSGLADPSNIGEFLEAVEVAKGDVYDYSGALCIVDGLNFLEQIEDIETVERQLKFCHLVVISKVDLIDEDRLVKVIEKIKEINDSAEIQTAINGKMDYDFLEKNLLEKGWIDSEDTTNTLDNKPKTLTLTYEGELTKEELTRFLDIIKIDSYRIKGFFKLEDGWNQVDVVNKKIDYKLTDKEETTSQLVIISKIGPQIIRPIFNAWESVVGKEMKLR
ncbi:CobW family GTP-binding protein [Sporanaerobacter acetigenes]|uniref:GTPase, G3E family n=1 Tax=Sporanaerobacter acetigenes DSM 13106 TaxID=1123281 RepID=A0A1M5XC83_9FIRM|nr:GTP-binding protein [Sporanaerobacter acetigenes]SHH97386.1 GTPase, G3E family [Sporanaerobacter acetigenes DSM 13106]